METLRPLPLGFYCWRGQSGPDILHTDNPLDLISTAIGISLPALVANKQMDLLLIAS